MNNVLPRGPVVEWKELLGSIDRGSYTLDFLRVCGPKGVFFQVAARGGRRDTQLTFSDDALEALDAALVAYEAAREATT